MVWEAEGTHTLQWAINLWVPFHWPSWAEMVIVFLTVISSLSL